MAKTIGFGGANDKIVWLGHVDDDKQTGDYTRQFVNFVLKRAC